MGSLREVKDTHSEIIPDLASVGLICFRENPSFRSPKIIGITELSHIKYAQFKCDSLCGPVEHGDFEWVGKFQVSVEVWERDSRGKPVCTFENTFEGGTHDTSFPFFKVPSTIASNIEPIEIKPEQLDHFWRHMWKVGMIDEARRRMGNCLRQRDQA